jgi:hypothetical protein
MMLQLTNETSLCSLKSEVRQDIDYLVFWYGMWDIKPRPPVMIAAMK